MKIVSTAVNLLKNSSYPPIETKHLWCIGLWLEIATHVVDVYEFLLKFLTKVITLYCCYLQEQKVYSCVVCVSVRACERVCL